jgi:integrative and conjugative element protein (TIGR02256 family)
MKGVRYVEYTYKTDKVALIINHRVFKRFHIHRQLHNQSYEGGGLLLGRTDINGTTRIYEITEPMDNDIRERITFKRRDRRHLSYLAEANNRCLYFKGNWHTHPQEVPNPSWLDGLSWKRAIKNSKPGESDYIFFVIVGIVDVNIWCGNMKTFEIEKMIQQFERGEIHEV